MTWLARMILHKEDLARRHISDTYAWHRVVWDCFPGRPDANRDFLLRLDWVNDCCRVYVLSMTEPIRPSWCLPEAWGLKGVAPSFLQHSIYSFNLLANPTRMVHVFDANGQRRKNGRRLALLHEDEQRRWLTAKAEQHGFRLEENAPLGIDEIGTLPFRRKQSTGTHIGVRFRGMLRVIDRKLFTEAFHCGIGTAKAFGFGMLLLQPIS